MKKIDKIKQDLEKLRQDKQDLLKLEEKYVEMIQDNCTHPLYLKVSSKKRESIDYITIKCLECEKEIEVKTSEIPMFKDESLRIIDWNNARLKKDLRFKIAQDEYRKFIYENDIKNQTKDSVAILFKQNMVDSCRKKV